jgi:hypothetical protein
MHAHVVSVDFTDVAAAVKGLDDLIPTVKAAPGFVAGYWVRLDDSHGSSIAVFETEDQARSTLPPVGAEMDGVRITSAEVGEVMGKA